MDFCKIRWLRHGSPVIALWIALAQTSAAALGDGPTSPAAESDGPSVLQVITQDPSPGKTAEESAASGEGVSGGPTAAVQEATVRADESGHNEPAVPAEKTSEEPTVLAEQEPEAQALSSEEPLTPMPDPEYSGIAPVESASFNGITPGVSTLQEVQEAWGPPKEVADRNAQHVQLYSVEPFDQVEVSFVKDRVTAIVIRFERPFPADVVSEQLELANIRPVLISDELGQILGQSFPERGVLFSFEPTETPGKASMKVVQIIIEPVGAEAFVLRAETYLDSHPDWSIRDLDQAIKIDPDRARAHWLRCRLLAAADDLEAAISAATEAVRLDPNDAQYRLTRAHVLGQVGRFAEGIEEAQKALADSTKRPHVKAQASCLLGDLLTSGPKPDYRQALQHHMEAIKTADPLAVSQHPAIRIAAKEVLIDAHLGAAHDIAWGPWDQKEKAVPRWLEQAIAVAQDLVQNDNGSIEHEFRVAAGHWRLMWASGAS